MRFACTHKIRPRHLGHTWVCIVGFAAVEALAVGQTWLFGTFSRSNLLVGVTHPVMLNKHFGYGGGCTRVGAIDSIFAVLLSFVASLVACDPQEDEERGSTDTGGPEVGADIDIAPGSDSTTTTTGYVVGTGNGTESAEITGWDSTDSGSTGTTTSDVADLDSATGMEDEGASTDGDGCSETSWSIDQQAAFDEAHDHARAAQRGFWAARQFVEGWWGSRDPETGLFPETVDGSNWTPKNAAADLWPFIVLSTHFTDRQRFEGEMRASLTTERLLTSRVGHLPDVYALGRGEFHHDTPDLGRIIFGASEYAKDGLMPIVENLGPGPYMVRLQQLLAGIVEHAQFETERGLLPADSREVNGEVLQIIARMYHATGNAAYLDLGLGIAQYYLTDDQLRGPVRLIDHGSEILAGLVEILWALREAGHDVGELSATLSQVLDRVLEVGRHEGGLFYNKVDLDSGEVLDSSIADTWGYVLDGYYTYDLMEGRPAYRDAVIAGLSALADYKDHAWADSDAFADTVESAIVLVNREPVPAALEFIESTAEAMFRRQSPSGVIGGWWGDGNFARTALMYALMHTRGVHTDAWRPDLRIGAAVRDDGLYLIVSADEPWAGRISFDIPRHREYLGLPHNYPRLNEFPEWFVVEAQGDYALQECPGQVQVQSAGAMRLGLNIVLEGSDLTRRMVVTPQTITPARQAPA